MDAERSAQAGIPTRVTIESESDDARGWVFEAEVSWKEAGVTIHEVSLAWVDHDAMSGGAEPPSELARRAVLVAASELGLDGLPDRFDLATLRRRIRGFEELVMSRR